MSETRASIEPVRTTFVQKLLLLVFGLLLLLLGLAAFEGILALLRVGETDRFADPFVGFEGSTTLFERRTGDDGRAVYATRPHKLTFFNHQEFPVEKAPGTLRVFTLGGSTTAGRPYDDHVSFARWLERYLDVAEPERRHEVINAGAISYASYRVLLLMKELVRYEPDVFVIYTGHNEFLEERTYRDRPQAQPVLDPLRQRLGRLRLASLVRRAVDDPEKELGTRLGDEVTTRLDVWSGLEAYERDDDLAQHVTEHFAWNLEQMVALAEAHGVAVVLVAPASNLKDFSPFKSEFRAGLPVAERRRVESFLERARKTMASGEPGATQEFLAAAFDLDPNYAELHFRLGRALLALGQVDAARAAFLRAKDLDVAPLRAKETLVDLVRETAVRHGLPLVDLPALLTERCGGCIPGAEIFLDHVHPDLPTQSLIAEQLMARLAEKGLVQLGGIWTDTLRRTLFEDVAADLDRQYYAQRDLNLAKVLGWAGKLEEAEAPLRRAAADLEGVADLHLNLGTLLQKTGRPEEAVPELEKAVELLPASPGAWFNLGVVYGRLGRLDEGIAALDEAIRLRPAYGEAFHNRGLLRHRNGEAEAALEDLERARELAPESAEVLRSLGRLHRQAGQLDAAVESFRESLQMNPRQVDTRVELAAALGDAGTTEEALALIEEVLLQDPDHSKAHYTAGLVLTRAGLLEEAITAYRQSVTLDPDDAPAHNNLGILLARTGDLESAHHHLRRAVELDPAYGEAFLNLGVVEDRAGRPKAAIQAIERAVELNPEEPRAHLALAMLYVAQGRLEEAQPHAEAARRGGLEIPASFERGGS